RTPPPLRLRRERYAPRRDGGATAPAAVRLASRQRKERSAMSPISRGFHGRRPSVDPARLPPGQYLTRDFPVLSAGPTPRTPPEEWSFTIDGAVDTPRSWTRAEFLALPSETFTVDIHCVTKWS